MKNPKLDWQDVQLALVTDTDVHELSLAQTVAAGRLFVQNQKGEFEQVEHASYWRNHENGYFGICNICVTGIEYDEDGQTTRDFSHLKQDKSS